jgi:hypothetical protein
LPSLQGGNTIFISEALCAFKEILILVFQIGPAFKQMKQSEKGTKNEIEEVRALYRKEALQRRLLYNQVINPYHPKYLKESSGLVVKVSAFQPVYHGFER